MMVVRFVGEIVAGAVERIILESGRADAAAFEVVHWNAVGRRARRKIKRQGLVAEGIDLPYPHYLR